MRCWNAWFATARTELNSHTKSIWGCRRKKIDVVCEADQEAVCQTETSKLPMAFGQLETVGSRSVGKQVKATENTDLRKEIYCSILQLEAQPTV
jgi:hypothetical protein